MKYKNGVAALAMAAIICVTILFSYIFIVENVHHNCSGDECSVCMEIEMAIQTISNLKVILFVPFVMALLCVFTQTCTMFKISNCTKDTLITLKVELLN